MPRLSEAFATTIIVPPGQREVFVFDSDHRHAVGGFFFRKFAETGRTFAGVKFTANGKQRRLSLGEVTQGTVVTFRKLAAEAKARARLGQDVLEERQQARAANRAAAAQSYTFGSAVGEYLLARERGVGFKRPMRARSLEEVTRHLRKHCRTLHAMELKAIRRADIVGLLDKIAVENGRLAANHTRVSVSGMCTWALDRGKIDSHPAIRVRSYGEPKSYRALTERELAEVWRAATGMGTYGDLVQLGILTALRKTNLRTLQWNEVDLIARELRIVGSRMKNGLDFTLPLSPEALEIFKARPRDGEFVFGGYDSRPIAWMSRRKSALDKRINADRPTKMERWVLHGLRATFTTIANNHDLAAPHILDELLAHKGQHKTGVRGIYNQARYEAQKREAMAKWGKLVSGLVSAEPSAA